MLTPKVLGDVVGPPCMAIANEAGSLSWTAALMKLD